MAAHLAASKAVSRPQVQSQRPLPANPSPPPHSVVRIAPRPLLQQGRRPAAAARPHQRRNRQVPRCAPPAVSQAEVEPEEAVDGMPAFLDSLKWDQAGLVAAVVQVQPLAGPTLAPFP